MPTRSIEYHRVAKAEARDAAVWYAVRSRRVALSFVDELEDAYRNIGAAESYPIEIRNVRWLKLPNFPYFIFFRILETAAAASSPCPTRASVRTTGCGVCHGRDTGRGAR